MKITLAGYNLDSEVIEALKRGEDVKDTATPEVLSASYARISRDPRPIDELRAVAKQEVSKARQLNQNVIFKMGHHSVAEHAVFNFDLIGVSRLALEEIEKFRLCSFTEKSQRYQTLEGNYLVPEEIENAGLKKLFVDTIDEQNAAYARMVGDRIEPEDARYLTSLATLGQVGLTLNARNLELMFRRFAASPLAEVREIGRVMFERIKPIAPSIILFTEPTALDRDTYPRIKKLADNIIPDRKSRKVKEVELVDCSRNADLKLVAALLHTVSDRSYDQCLKITRSLTEGKKAEIIKSALSNMEFYDSALREFEYPDLTFELVVSAACFAQLKRHRLATLTCQGYDPELGPTIPPAIIKAGREKEFMKIFKAADKAFRKIGDKAPAAATYILTNAHRRRVLFKCSARELYHISRLREDAHAQWDIQNISKLMADVARKAMPLAFSTIGGKDRYTEIYRNAFGRDPRIAPQAG
ncbi:MAG TPA: FAD-dependent thymidylate synthase [Candidatus Omnitrophota bacterium]|nr:FAD-dependent thymidylate synthase [Candidatus Omnitrophota bacterium]